MSISIEDFIAGWCGGVCGLVIGHPLETIKVRQQAYGEKLWASSSRTFRHEGIRGFFKGIALPLWTIGPANALLFGIYGNTISYFNKTKDELHNISFSEKLMMIEVFTAGVCGGFFQTVLMCPVEVVKTVLQASVEGSTSWKKHDQKSYRGTFDAVFKIFKESGLKGFFRGWTPLMLRDVPTSGLYTLTYEMLMYYYFSQCDSPLIVKQTIAGGSAGIASWIFVFPLDVVKNRMQVDNPKHPYYRGMIDCFYKSYKEGGYRVFFKGAMATLFRTFPVNAAIFIGYEFTLKQFSQIC